MRIISLTVLTFGKPWVHVGSTNFKNHTKWRFLIPVVLRRDVKLSECNSDIKMKATHKKSNGRLIPLFFGKTSAQRKIVSTFTKRDIYCIYIQDLPSRNNFLLQSLHHDPTLYDIIQMTGSRIFANFDSFDVVFEHFFAYIGGHFSHKWTNGS